MATARTDEPTPARALRMEEVPHDLREDLAAATMKPRTEDDLPLMGRHPPTD